jgi:hypothetical protein
MVKRHREQCATDGHYAGAQQVPRVIVARKRVFPRSRGEVEKRCSDNRLCAGRGMEGMPKAVRHSGALSAPEQYRYGLYVIRITYICDEKRGVKGDSSILSMAWFVAPDIQAAARSVD